MASSGNIVFKEVDLKTNIGVGNIRKTASGARTTYFNNPTTNQSLTFQLNETKDDWIEIPFGISTYDGSDKDRQDMVANVENPALVTFLTNLMTRVQDMAVEHKSEWFDPYERTKSDKRDITTGFFPCFILLVILRKTLVKEVIHCRIYRKMRLSKGP